MNTFAATTTDNTEIRARPRLIADLLVVPSAAKEAMDANGTRSSSHWVAVVPDLAAEKAPAHVKALARDLGVDTSLAWAALDSTYS